MSYSEGQPVPQASEPGFIPIEYPEGRGPLSIPLKLTRAPCYIYIYIYIYLYICATTIVFCIVVDETEWRDAKLSGAVEASSNSLLHSL